MCDYESFLESKVIKAPSSGIDVTPDNPALYDFQRAITAWALRKGRAAIFADCGLGKTIMQLCWAREVHRHTDREVLILAPLAVAAQTVEEGRKFGIEVTYRRKGSVGGITITNYEMLKNFDPELYSGIVLDESSILKSFSGKIRNFIIDSFKITPYRLACTATPAPNDLMELANHAEFLGIMRREEMLSTFFFHDSGNTSKWVIKGHAESDFWKWVCSWAVMLNYPSDIGFNASGFELPELRMHEEIVSVEEWGNYLFAMEAQSLQDRIKERRRTVAARVEKAAEILSRFNGDPAIVWCNLNMESSGVKKRSGCTEIVGSEKAEVKAKKMLDFSAGKIKKLVTKPSIAGFGMNWQHCNNVIFLGLSDSYEQFYQALRRCWRFGQKKPVDVYIVIAETEGEVLANIKRKEQQAKEMRQEMVKNMQDITKRELGHSAEDIEVYDPESTSGSGWTVHNGDCVEIMRTIESEAVGYSIFSPPFLSLYSYSDSNRDFGNSKTDGEFYEHFRFFADELYRVIMPGRNFSFHVANVPCAKWLHGYIGLRDFRGECIRLFQDAGFIFHSEVCIWKDPVTAMQRTKALGLLYKQLKKDSAMSRQGIPDYLITMKKWGDNPDAIEQKPENFPLSKWQKYASPVWTDVNQSRTLQYRNARDEKDEKHICPLQLDVIERGLELWSRPGDLVLSPFAGIGSEGYVAVSMGREFVGIELKKSYYRVACQNLVSAENCYQQQFLF